jgi:hypothetical protein
MAKSEGAYDALSQRLLARLKAPPASDHLSLRGALASRRGRGNPFFFFSSSQHSIRGTWIYIEPLAPLLSSDRAWMNISPALGHHYSANVAITQYNVF